MFVLHDTYGFPSELTREIAAEAASASTMHGFEAAMEEQRERARADAPQQARGRAGEPRRRAGRLAYEPADGVHRLRRPRDGRRDRRDLGDGRPVERIDDGAKATVVLDRTSFYAEKGGQIGDRGAITANGARFDVTDTQFAEDGKHVGHRGALRGGSLAVGDAVHAAVYPEWREEIRRDHTSAHLLQRALKDVLGDDVVQAGSWVGIDRMRFDFRSPALTPEQRAAVQRASTS